MIIYIYDTGGIYQMDVDPDNPPEWLLRSIELEVSTGDTENGSP